ncbi:MAG TPA: glutamate--tRNA ligase [bacterium]|nr:glutamate--tRNA ligase [bacterium]
MRNAQKEKGLVTQYDRKCRNLTDEQIQNYLKQNLPFVIRMKTPLTGSISFYDLIREEVTIPFANVDDQILLKSDGFPTYHLANVVDDHFMKITAVIRGEEWLMSTPKHLLLYNFFKWTPPQFAHLPLLLNPDRSKLSKRQGDVAVSDYKNNGFLPEAVLNFIALLGWNPGDDREILSKSELIELFDISKCGKSGSVFDIAKLKWMNGYYIRYFEKTDQQKLINYYKNYLISNNFIDENYPIEKLKLIIKLTSEKIETINDLNKFTDLLFNENFNYESDAEREISKSENFKKLKSALFESLEKIEELTDKNLMTFIKDIQNQTGIKGKELYKLLRILISGHSEGPDLATLFLFFNKSGIVNRLKNLK